MCFRVEGGDWVSCHNEEWDPAVQQALSGDVGGPHFLVFDEIAELGDYVPDQPLGSDNYTFRTDRKSVV